MSRNIFEPSPDRQIRRNTTTIKSTRQKPGAFKWWVPDCDETDDAQAGAGCSGEEPPLENGWAQPGDGLQKFAFRLHSDGSLETRGHLDSAGASSGTVAVTIPGANAGEVDFLDGLEGDQFWHTVIYDGATPQGALAFIEKATGELTITFPI